MTHVTSMYGPLHNAGTLQEHLSTTIQLLLAITLQAHVRLHLKCEGNVVGDHIGCKC